MMTDNKLMGRKSKELYLVIKEKIIFFIDINYFLQVCVFVSLSVKNFVCVLPKNTIRISKRNIKFSFKIKKRLRFDLVVKIRSCKLDDSGV